MQDIKPEDPEFWCRMYASKTEEQTSKKNTKSRVRSKSYSPSRAPVDSSHHLNLSGQLESVSASLASKLPPATIDDRQKQQFDLHERQDAGRATVGSGRTYCDVATDATKEKGDVSSVKRKKARGKARAHDRATAQFIRKARADFMPCCERNSSGQISDFEADNVNRKAAESKLHKVETSSFGPEKGTPGLSSTGNIQQNAVGMQPQDNPPCPSSAPGMHGLCPGMTHNAYVLHWLQQHSGQPQNQTADRNIPRLQNCHPLFQGPSNSCYPLHSSPVRQSLYAYGDCPCTPGKQSVTNELMTMIQQEAAQTSLLPPPGDFHPTPTPCPHPHQIPISPDAKSFLAMLQHKPEMSTLPCGHCPTHLACIEQTCHALGGAGHSFSSPNVQCVSQCGQAWNSPQYSACSPIVSPPRVQQGSPYRSYHPPNVNTCSLEHAAMLLHQSHQLHDSPVRLGTSGPRSCHGSPARQMLMHNSPANSSQQMLEDSVATCSFYNGSADRSKCDDKIGTGENPAPIGVFWDIENCAVPRGKSALAVVQSVRDRFFGSHRESEFMCVCDINKENATVIQELNDAQVTVAHINATAKNAADDKLKQSLRRFADTHSPPATVVLISGDINFARDLSDLRHRNNLRVILVHRDEASEALKACANEVVRYQDLVHDLPYRSPTKQSSFDSSTLVVHNLPCRKDASQLRNRLKQLSENCGGKVIHVSYKNAVIQFPNVEKASRAKIRLDGEMVFGNKISVAYPKNKFNVNSPARRSNKASPQSIQDNNEDTMASHSDSKGDEEEQYDTKEEATEEQDERSSRSDSEHRACTGSKNGYQSGRPSSSVHPRFSPADSPSAETAKELPASNTSSANRIAAAFRPIQHDLKYSNEYRNSPASSADSKPVIEIWPQRECPSVEARTLPNTADLIPVHVSASAVSLMYCPSNVPPNEHPNRLLQTGQLNCNVKVMPGLLPFKPAPTVQRIPTPPQFQQGQALLNRSSCEQRSNSPTLRGTYRPPSPMLANPMGDWQYMSVQDPDNGVRKGAELLVMNLDNKMSRQDLKKSLLAKLNEHCKVLHLIFGSPVPGRYQAVVRVPSIPDAIRAMANINRCQIGTRLLHVSLLMPTESNADKLRLMIIPMLQEIPGMCQPLCDMKTSFERRYRQILFVSDLYNIPDTITIRETSVGKVVALTTQSRPSTPNSEIHSPAGNQSAGSQSAASFFTLKEPLPEPCEPFCSLHDSQDTLQYRHVTQDPFVIVSIRTFSSQVHTLLLLHNGKIPLISFMVCYAAEFPALREDFDNGVPLEHLLTCIQGVRVGVSREGFKTVCWEQSQPQTETGSRSSTPLLPPQLFQFSKEAVELLKHTSRCRLAFSKFIPGYHHHFGRQCRVADYGFLKLIELFDAIAHVIQVLGMTENKLLTLTHRAQIKRFSQDLLKVLKSQASKQVTLEEFPTAYLRCFNKPWKVTDYGVCDLQDLLTEVPETMAMINWNGDDTLIFIPKREQSGEEMIRMRKFSREVVDLLSSQPRYRILFSKFIPTYHHHFGRQCRVGDYGFNKLLELFEGMEEVIQVEEQGDERVVMLTNVEQLALIGRHTSEMLQRNRLHLINLDVFNEMYTRCYMYPVYLKDYQDQSLQELMGRFPHVVEIVSDGSKQHLHLVEKMHLSQLAQQMLVVLLESEDGRLPIGDVGAAYRDVWGQELIPIEYGYSRLVTLMKMLHYVLTVQNEWLDGCFVELTPSHQFARQVRNVLVADNRLSITFQELVVKYHKLHGVELQPANFGHGTLTSLIDTVPRVLSVVNQGAKRAVTLNPSCLVPGLQTEAGKTSSLRRLSDQRISFIKDAAEIQPASGMPQSLSVEETLTSTEKLENDDTGRPMDISDTSRAPRQTVNRNRGRCQLAANFSMKDCN